jgi:hypothetical protein
MGGFSVSLWRDDQQGSEKRRHAAGHAAAKSNGQQKIKGAGGHGTLPLPFEFSLCVTF